MGMTDQQRLDAYTGGGGYASGAYLVRHVRETDEKFARRQALARYLNYPRKIVDAYRGTLFARPASRSGEARPWQALQESADGRGGALDDLMRRVDLLAKLLGTCYCIVDRPRGVSRTRADDLARPPYVVLRKPGDVAALVLDEVGTIERVVFAEAGARVTYGGTAAGGVAETRYRGFDSQRWWVSRDIAGEEVLVDADTDAPLAGEHGLGRVPVVRHHSTELMEVTDERAPAWAEGVIALSDDLFQLRSEYRDLLRAQGFATLTLPFRDPGEIDRLRDSGLTLGSENALPYNPEGGGAPAYIAPPAQVAQSYRDAIADTVQALYQLANLEFTGGVQQSGVALAFHFQAANDSLALQAQMLEQTEQELGRLASAWLGTEPGEDLRVVYPRQFAVEELAARLAEDLDALTLQLGPTAERLIRSRAARRVLGDSASPDDYEQIDAELQTAAFEEPDPYQDRIAREAGPDGVGVSTDG